MGKSLSPDLEAGQQRTKIPYFNLLTEHGYLTPEVEQWQYAGSGTEEDPYVVVWIPNDTRNPFNWSFGYRWATTMSLSFATMAVSLCSSAYAGGIPGLVDEFHTSEEVATLGLSLYVLGFAVGPLLWAPFSEIYGRQIIFFITFAGFTAFDGGVIASQNIWSVIILRFFAGSFGASPFTNAGGVIADIFPARQRGLAVSVFGSCVFLGPSLGPVISGFIGESAGWRWVMAFITFLCGFVWIQCSLILPETYAPVLLSKRADALSRKFGKVYKSKAVIDQGTTPASKIFRTSMSRPWILLFKEPIVLILTIYLALIYGTLYMFFSAFPIVYQEGRGWSEGIGGLAFLGILVGMLIGMAYLLLFEDRRYQKVSEAHNGAAPAEARLPASLVGAIALPIGLFWFAWTNSPSLQWAASVAAGIPFGFGMLLVFLSLFTYLVDSYVIFAASALAANSILRSLFGAIFPLFTTYMYKGIGIHWASTITAFLALACAPFPFVFYKYGASIRAKCKYAAEAEAFLQRLRGDAPPSPPASDEDAPAPAEDDEKATLDGSKDGDGKTLEAPLDGQSNMQKTLSQAPPQIPRLPPSKTSKEVYEDPQAQEDAAWSAANADPAPASQNTERQSRSELRRGPRGRPSVRSPDYEHSPFDIDRVNTRDSFRSEAGRNSRSASRGAGSGVVSRAISRVASRRD